MFGTGEIVVILAVILVLFGGKKLPELAKNLGKGIREFKRACEGKDDEDEAKVTVEIDHKQKQDAPGDNS